MIGIRDNNNNKESMVQVRFEINGDFHKEKKKFDSNGNEIYNEKTEHLEGKARNMVIKEKEEDGSYY